MAEAKEVSKTSQELSLVFPSEIVYFDAGDDAVLSCHFEPAISAASMEIKWWKKADLVCHYKNGQVTVNRDYEGRVNLSLEDLHNGNLSLTLRDVRSSQMGLYICEVIYECQKIQDTVFLNISSEDFRLVTPVGTVSADPGSEVILPVHLSPETSAVSLDIRWFRGTELIYQCKNRQEKTNHENRVSLSIQELEKGNLALTLRNFQPADSGDYTCKVFHDGCLQTGTVHLQVREIQTSDDPRVVHLHSVLRKVQKYILQHKEQLLQETSNVLQETFIQDEIRKIAFDPTLRRSTSIEGIPPHMKEEDMHHRHTIMEKQLFKPNIFKKRSSSVPVKIQTSDDPRVENLYNVLRKVQNDILQPKGLLQETLHMLEETLDQDEIRNMAFVAGHDGGQQVLSQLRDIIEESTIVPTRARTHAQENPETSVQSTATEQETSSSDLQSQLRERERPSESVMTPAGESTPTPERPEDGRQRNQQGHENREENCQIM
ncbi:uncharacterized protein LOC113092762 [Carassius auratus]|uniref:Uncharacterized protein LOC113092762 n=1 Tax=Carassius auratus TaxID=7957 RepID=A0A6P6P041_CARAU|nr:uncharacterized protein LOC113092762 [Carassius auratus]